MCDLKGDICWHGCSGLETPVYCIGHLQEALSIATQLALPHWQQLYACEQDKKLIEWIRAFSPDLQIVFTDILELSSGRGHCACLGGVRNVPRAKWIYAGFVCKDMSLLNRKRRTVPQTLSFMFHLHVNLLVE